jgi:hypothetical protein
LRDRDVLELWQSLVGVRVGRRQDPVADGLVALVLKQRRFCVSNVRESKRVKRVQRRDHGAVGAYRRSVALPFTCGGAAILISAAWRRGLARV